MDEIPNLPMSLCYLGGPLDIIRDWRRLQGASAQQEKVILAALDSNYLISLPKPRKWRDLNAIPRNRVFRSKYYQQVARILGWKERHVHGFSEVVRDTLRNVVWPNHGGEQGDMAADYPRSIGEKGGLHIDVAIERSALAKGGECKKEGSQVSNQEGASMRTTMTQITYTKGWSEGKKRAGERLKIAAKRGTIVSTDKASAPINNQGQKRKAAEATRLLPSRKGQLDAYSQSGAGEDRFTELVVVEHEVAVRVPKYHY